MSPMLTRIFLFLLSLTIFVLGLFMIASACVAVGFIGVGEMAFNMKNAFFTLYCLYSINIIKSCENRIKEDANKFFLLKSLCFL